MAFSFTVEEARRFVAPEEVSRGVLLMGSIDGGGRGCIFLLGEAVCEWMMAHLWDFFFKSRKTMLMGWKEKMDEFTNRMRPVK